MKRKEFIQQFIETRPEHAPTAAEIDEQIRQRKGRMVDGMLHFPVGRVSIDLDGEAIDIGKLCLKLDADEFFGSVPRFGMRVIGTKPRGRCPHPNVNPDGNPCLGNVSGLVRRLIRSGQLGDAVDLVIEVLKGYGPDGYVDPELWKYKRICQSCHEPSNTKICKRCR